MGYEVYKAHSAEVCLKKMDELKRKIDVVFIDGRTAIERGSMLIVHFKSRSQNTKMFVLAERKLEDEKTRVLDHEADEFTAKPLGTQNIVDKANRLLFEGRIQ